MTIQEFLDKEQEYNRGVQKQIQNEYSVRLINFILDKVEEEINNLKYDNSYDIEHCKESNKEYFYGAKNSLEDISTIINQLRIK